MSANPDTAAPTGRGRRTTFVLAVPLPPLAEQTRIVAEVERRMSVVEELESVVTANLRAPAASARPF